MVRRRDARAVEWTAAIVLSYVHVNGLEAMQCYAELNLTLCDDRQVWRANIMPAAMPGGVQSIQSTTDTWSSFLWNNPEPVYFTRLKSKTLFSFKNSQCVHAKCHQRQSSFLS